MAGIDWFRWHHGSVTDPKFALVAKRSGARLGDVVTLWAFLLEQSSASDDRGSIGPLDMESIELLLDLQDGQCMRILDAMCARGLITDHRISRWDKRQPRRERPDDSNATERKREQRAREAESRAAANETGVTPDVTPRHATSRHVTPREEESREDVNPPTEQAASTDSPIVCACEPAAALTPADAISMRATQLAVLLYRRGAQLQSGDPRVRAWAERGVTDAQALQALEIAQSRRNERGSAQAINAGYLETIIRDLETAPAAGQPRASPSNREVARAIAANTRLSDVIDDSGRLKPHKPRPENDRTIEAEPARIVG